MIALALAGIAMRDKDTKIVMSIVQLRWLLWNGLQRRKEAKPRGIVSRIAGKLHY